MSAPKITSAKRKRSTTPRRPASRSAVPSPSVQAARARIDAIFALRPTPRSWEDRTDQLKYFDIVAESLDLKDLEGWYGVTLADITEAVGTLGPINSRHNKSLVASLKFLHPHHQWHPWKFVNTPRSYWRARENVRQFADWAALQLGVQHMDDWYRFGFREIARLGGNHILRLSLPTSTGAAALGSAAATPAGRKSDLRNAGLHNLMCWIYPEHEWKPWKWRKVKGAHWASVDRRREFFDALGRHLSLTHLDDWYNVSRKQVQEFGGSGLLAWYYNDSLLAALSDVYPGHQWLPFRFTRSPRRMLTYVAPSDDPESRSEDLVEEKSSIPPRKGRLRRPTSSKRSNLLLLKRLLEHVASELAVKDLGDWYRVSQAQFIHAGGSQRILHIFKGLGNMLQVVYPSHRWEPAQFSNKLKKSAQRELAATMARLYPHTELIEETDNDVLGLHESMRKIKFDLWLPAMRLAVEFEGQQHFDTGNTTISEQELRATQRRQAKKVETCRRLGISLLFVPFWWDRTEATLKAAIKEVHPAATE